MGRHKRPSRREGGGGVGGREGGHGGAKQRHKGTRHKWPSRREGRGGGGATKAGGEGRGEAVTEGVGRNKGAVAVLRRRTLESRTD